MPKSKGSLPPFIIMRGAALLLLSLLLLTSKTTTLVAGFLVTSPASLHHRSQQQQIHRPVESTTAGPAFGPMVASAMSTITTTTTRLYNSSAPDPGGMRRGLIIFPIVFLLNVWMFTIPPEFRRTKICNDEQSQLYPNQCMTMPQWMNGVKEYYKNGGGIHFDFSIDPNTLADNEELRKTLFSK
jgi:hypothetical protein